MLCPNQGQEHEIASGMPRYSSKTERARGNIYVQNEHDMKILRGKSDSFPVWIRDRSSALLPEAAYRLFAVLFQAVCPKEGGSAIDFHFVLPC